MAAGTPPTGFTGIALDGKVDLNWQPVAGASAYTVYRGTSSSAINTQITPTGGVALPGFTDATAVNGTTYYYAVRSVVAGSESSNSLTVQATPRARSCSTGNATAVENCFPGDTSWKLTNPTTTNGIEGFATAASINKGGSVDLKINTGGAATFRIEVYRTGYYGGAGARLFSTILGVSGVNQPACTGPDATTGLIDCSNWSVSATITTTSSWPSGVYLLRVVRNDNGADNHLILIVRDDARHSDLLYGVGMSTFEAYNAYGGKSLYDFNSAGVITVAGTARAVKVSFDRPFTYSRTTEPNWYTRDEHQAVMWLEQEGYDVSYISDTDLETNPSQVTNHRAYMMAAHDEYWSAGMRTAVEQGVAAGVGLFDMGANNVYWKIRFENGPNGGQNRLEVCYKSTQSGGADPSGIPTGTWRDPAGANKPENALLGVMYVGDNDQQPYPLVVTAANGANTAWRYTGLDAQPTGSSTKIGTSIVGWEWDARFANGFEPAGVTELADSPATGELIQHNGKDYINGSTTVQTTRYVAPSGAVVFATGTNQWDWGLAVAPAGDGQPDVRIQQATANALSDMGALPQTPDSSLTVDDPKGLTITPPTGFTATPAGSDSITLSWNAVAGATGYDVYRSTVARNGGVPAGTDITGSSSVSGTTYTDFGLNSGATYYYVVTAVKNGIHSGQSTEARATTMSSGSGSTVRINTGGGAYTSSTGRVFSADTSFTGGATYLQPGPIAGTPDPALYTDERYGQFSYSIAVANGTYDVRLHFVELYYGSVIPGSCVGKRIFGMDILNTPASPDISNLDICAQVGPRAALVKTISGVQVTNGVLTIQSVYGPADDPEVAAIEVVPSAPAGPPTVSSTSPASGATGVSVTAPVKATFSRSMDATTITTSSFTLTKAGDGGVAGTVSYDSTTNTATLTPTAALAYSTTYTANLATTIKSADGQALASAVTWSFTTGPPPPPTVTSTVPASGATGVSTGTQVKATFSRAMDPTTITNASFSLAPNGGSAIGAVISYDSTSNTATLTPSAALAVGTTYTATITTAVKASDGTPLASAFTWSFTTVNAPTVTSTSPASGATNVATTSTVKATFSRAMDPTTITSSSFTLTPSGGSPVAATVSYDSTSNTATLTPSAALAFSTTYTATVAASVKASDGTPLAGPVTWSFTTAAPAPPTVTSTVPASGATGVATGVLVKATFSRPMDPTTITASTFTLAKTGDGAVAATVSYDSTTNTATLTPSAPLANGTGYTATISTGAKASDGTPLASAFSWSFTTIAAPTVTSTSPASGATGVSPATQVKATFSRAMDATTITTSSFTLTPSGGSPVAATVSYDSTSNTATLTPSASLALSTTYTANLDTTVKASDGTPLASAVSWSFTTSATTSSPPTVTSTTPASGATGVAATSTVTATFSRAMDATTITSSSFTVAANGATPVAATVSYNATTNTATLTPSTPFLFSASYTASLAASIKAADGTPLAAAVTWSFTTQAGTTTRINTGGGAYTSGSGAAFVADADFTGGSIYATSSTISGTSDPALFQNERWGQFTYNIPVTNGVYDVKLEFVELYYGTAVSGSCVGKRIFGMDILDTAVSPDIANLDICAQAGGPNTALIKTISGVSVTDGQLNIKSVYGSIDDPEIAAIEVIPAAAPPAPPGPPTVTAKTPADGATGISTGTTVTATFSRSMDATTITSSSFTLKAPDGSTVPASVAYNGTSLTATLTPTAALANSTTYTANLATTIKASDGQALASAVTWSFTTAASIGSGTTTIRINTGGGPYTSGSGATFLTDTDFTGGSTYATTSTITGTSDPALYQNERWGQFTYNIPVTNGTYTVMLDFVELYYGTAVAGSCVGKRIFGMDILNTPASPDIANLDICAQAGGPNKALQKTITGVQVTNGTLSIQSVYGSVDDPEIAAIEVVPG